MSFDLKREIITAGSAMKRRRKIRDDLRAAEREAQEKAKQRTSSVTDGTDCTENKP